MLPDIRCELAETRSPNRWSPVSICWPIVGRISPGMHPLSINAAANAVLSFATGCIILGNYSDYRVVFRQVTARWREDAHANVIPTRHRGTEWFSPRTPFPAPSPAVMSSPQTSRKGIRNERISGTHGVDNHRFRSLTPELRAIPGNAAVFTQRDNHCSCATATIAFIFRRSASPSCGAEAKAKSRCGTSVARAGCPTCRRSRKR